MTTRIRATGFERRAEEFLERHAPELVADARDDFRFRAYWRLVMELSQEFADAEMDRGLSWLRTRERVQL